MLWKYEKKCSVMLLSVSINIQASELNNIIYLQCVDEDNRLEIRTKMSECDSVAIEKEGANYNIGIFRPATSHDDLTTMDVPDCEIGKLSQAYYYGQPLKDNSWGSDWGPIFGEELGMSKSIKPTRSASGIEEHRVRGYGEAPYKKGWKEGSTLYLCIGAPGAR
jgi:hypothetical protein